MKFVFFTAALIFSAATLNIGAQTPSATPDPTVTPVTAGTPIPEDRVQISRLPPSQRPAPLVFPNLSNQQQSIYTRPDANTRFKRYVNGMVGPVALARQVAGAGIGTWRNSPEEWGGQWEGFGKRLASGFGKNLIKQTVTYGLDEALKLDSHYYRSKRNDAGSKIKNALLSPVTARNRSGKRVLGIPKIVGTYTSSIAATELWFPDRYDWKDGVRNGTVSFAFNAAFNLFKEFVWKK
jgi:hypothetical protein